ncbi:MAG: DivIVA domain-containing protein [Eubacteriales bacterium]|nr:DivIVA domain-containing protein [Eubacteriales bacterium]
MITPKEIQTVRFSNSVRGYNRKDVDEFLDQLTIDYQNVLDENRNCHAEISKLRKEIEEQKRSENSVMNTLEQAKRLMNDISESAEKRAEVIIRNAHLDADGIIRSAKDSVASYTEEAEMLQRKITKFREKFRDLLNEELGRVDQSVDDLFEGLETEIEHQRDNETLRISSSDKTGAAASYAPEDMSQTRADLEKTKVIRKDDLRSEAKEEKTEPVPVRPSDPDQTQIYRRGPEDLGKTRVISKEDLAKKAKEMLRSEEDPLTSKEDYIDEIDREIAENKENKK